MTHEINLFDQPDVDDESNENPVSAPVEPIKEKIPEAREATTEQLVAMLDKLQAKQQAERLEQQMMQQVKRVLEALLFASSEPIPFNRLREIGDMVKPTPPRHLRRLLEELQQEYIAQERAFRLEEMQEGWILRSCPEYSKYIAELYRDKRGERLSHAATETLAIIAYRQPVTRPQVDDIRGVDSSGSVHNLLERGLIEPCGKLDGPGKPTLYRTTRKFLNHYGLCGLEDLPQLAEEPVVQENQQIS